MLAAMYSCFGLMAPILINKTVTLTIDEFFTYATYRRIFCDVICLHSTMNCDPLTQQDKMF